MDNLPSCFNEFTTDIGGISIDEQFVYPFYYTPTRLALIAAEELKILLEKQGDLAHNFGISPHKEGLVIGKMFGVLVVKNKTGKIGFLCAFSGKLAGENHHPFFVPPVFDMLVEDGFFRKEEKRLNEFNKQIENLQSDPSYLHLLDKKIMLINEASEAIQVIKKNIVVGKALRKTLREKAIQNEDQQILSTLEKESIREQYHLKEQRTYWKIKLDEIETQIAVKENELLCLKAARKKQSSALQQELFENYTFLNSLGDEKNLGELFLTTFAKKPPAGAGECAAPKLLQYAFNHGLQPITLAEFWWGQSPKSEIRVHGNFYPACRGKCGPILAHMLQGLNVAANPMLHNPAVGKTLKIIYQDEHLVIIDKPTEFLAVPGINIKDSVAERMRIAFPNATGPLVVHRLDMATSGLMLIALTSAVYIALQKQFIDRKIKKEYLALLDGIVEKNHGQITLPIRVDLDDRPRQLVCFDFGKMATTEWEVLERKENRTRVLFKPITGRTHQLRVHAAHVLGLNTPIVGDDLYGKMDTRLHLHAARIIFTHPITKEIMDIKLKPSF